MLDAQTAITELVAAGGNPALAAANASRDGVTISAGQLLAIIARDPSSPALLYNQLKMLMVLQAFDAFSKTHMAYLQQLTSLAPRDLARTYTQLIDSFTQLTGNAPQPVNNPIDAILSVLPPEISEAVNVLIAPPSEDATFNEVPAPAVPAVPAAQREPPTDLEWRVPNRG